MKLKIRISYFNLAKVYDPCDYPEVEVTMTESEFYDLLEKYQCYYDEYLDIHYACDESIGFTILEVM